MALCILNQFFMFRIRIGMMSLLKLALLHTTSQISTFSPRSIPRVGNSLAMDIDVIEPAHLLENLKYTWWNSSIEITRAALSEWVHCKYHDKSGEFRPNQLSCILFYQQTRMCPRLKLKIYWWRCEQYWSFLQSAAEKLFQEKFSETAQSHQHLSHIRWLQQDPLFWTASLHRKVIPRVSVPNDVSSRDVILKTE